jgi:hypothetical protein
MASNSERITKLERMIEAQNRTIVDMKASMHSIVVNNAKTTLAIFTQMGEILTEMKRNSSDVSKDLKEVRMKLRLREGLTRARNYEGLFAKVYKSSDAAVKENKPLLDSLHRVAHANGRFPKKTNQEYKNAEKHLKHRSAPGNSTSSVYKKGQTNVVRKFKKLVDDGTGVRYGKKRKREDSDATATSASRSSPASTARFSGGGGRGSGR